MRPSARILHKASTQKMVRNTGSAFSSCTDNGVLSLSGRCSSIAIVTHDDTIVIKTVYSNGGHSMINLNSRRIGFVSPRINNDVGPGAFSVEFWAEITLTFTLWFDFVVVAWVWTFAPWDASCMAAALLNQNHNRFLKTGEKKNGKKEMIVKMLRIAIKKRNMKFISWSKFSFFLMKKSFCYKSEIVFIFFRYTLNKICWCNLFFLLLLFQMQSAKWHFANKFCYL